MYYEVIRSAMFDTSMPKEEIEELAKHLADAIDDSETPEVVYRQAAHEYAKASSQYELAVMSGNRTERAAAENVLEDAGERYARAMARTAKKNPPLSLVDALAQPWSQPDPKGEVSGAILRFNQATSGINSATMYDPRGVAAKERRERTDEAATRPAKETPNDPLG